MSAPIRAVTSTLTRFLSSSSFPARVVASALILSDSALSAACLAVVSFLSAVLIVLSSDGVKTPAAERLAAGKVTYM